MRLSIPHNTGDDAKFKKSLGYFKSQIQAFENSNANLHIDCERDWDENVLKGKLVGALFNEKEWEKDGRKAGLRSASVLCLQMIYAVAISQFQNVKS